MSYLCIMAFWFCLAESNKLYKKHVYNSIMPSNDTEPSYNISFWVRQLHLQQCVIVEIGDKYGGVFVEYRPTELQTSKVEEYFLGLCDLSTLRKWKFCPWAVENERPRECVFQEYTEMSNNPIRVHRRLCDVTSLSFYGEQCNCSSTILRKQKLYEVTGFPTCFLPQLPESLCMPRNVCGVSSCNASTVNKIHTVKCNTQCLGGQPFCELPGPETTRASEITSYWSDWIEFSCNGDFSNCTDDLIQSQAVCINKNTGMGAVDCLGPGTNCCPANAEKCKCYIYMEDGMLKLFRELKLKQSSSQLQRNPRNSYPDLVMRQRQENKNVMSPERLLDANNFARRKHFKKRDKLEEEEYEDDDADETNDEDIILEEDENETPIPTTQQAEKGENKHEPESDKKKIAIEEMGEDLNQTQLDEESEASVLASDVFINVLIFCGYFLCLFVGN